MGVVYQALDERLGREVAVKVIAGLANGASRDRLRTRFHREARAAARLRHPNVVTVYDFGSDAEQDIDYIVLELLRGEDLATLLEWRRSLPVDEALPILIGAARGVGAGHRAGLIHRDIKPGNLYLERDRDGRPPRARVLDFGIAQIVDPEVTVTMLTVFGHVPHTPAFASPEQRNGRVELNFASDVYSLGATGYRLITGEPLPGVAVRAPRSVMRTQLGNAGANGALTQVMMQALSLHPARRFPDGDALADALEDVLRRIEVTALKRNLGFGGSSPRVQEDRTDEEEGSATNDLPGRDWEVARRILRLLLVISVFVLGWCARAGS
jgi:serine/threonine protein kinase